MNPPYIAQHGQNLESEVLEEVGCWDVQKKTWDIDRIYLEPPVDLKLGTR